MKNSPYFVLCLLIAFGIESYSQNKTFISYEIGVGKDYVYFKNPSEDLKLINTSSGIPAIVLSQQISKYLFVDTGIRNDYMQLDLENSSTPENEKMITFSRNELQIPLLLKFKKSLIRDKLNVYILLGIVYSIGSKENNLKVDDSEIEIIDYQLNKNYILGEMGIGVEYTIFKKFYLGINYRYNFGFKNHIHIVGQGMNSQFSLTSKGNSGVVGICFGYEISSLWNKK